MKAAAYTQKSPYDNMNENHKLRGLQEQRARVSAWLFLARCCLAWLPIGVLHLIGQRSIGGTELALYVIGIPALLWLYDLQ